MTNEQYMSIEKVEEKGSVSKWLWLFRVITGLVVVASVLTLVATPVVAPAIASLLSVPAVISIGAASSLGFVASFLEAFKKTFRRLVLSVSQPALSNISPTGSFESIDDPEERAAALERYKQLVAGGSARVARGSLSPPALLDVDSIPDPESPPARQTPPLAIPGVVARDTSEHGSESVHSDSSDESEYHDPVLGPIPENAVLWAGIIDMSPSESMEGPEFFRAVKTDELVTTSIGLDDPVDDPVESSDPDARPSYVGRLLGYRRGGKK